MGFALHPSLDIGFPDVHAPRKSATRSGSPAKPNRSCCSHRDTGIEIFLKELTANRMSRGAETLGGVTLRLLTDTTKAEYRERNEDSS